jgi:glutamate/tyrosine decarboxylase-like PLP-dependent enzyme
MPDDSNAFDWSAPRREEVGRAALQWTLDWFNGVGTRRLYPDVKALRLDHLASSALPLDPGDPLAVIDEFASQVASGSRDNGHPRMFGYVQSSGTFMGAAADYLASALNANVTSWRSSPAAATIERQVVAWIKQMVRFDGDGLLVSGGSMANFVGLVAATVSAHPEVAKRGVRALPGEPVVYASDLVHMSIPKAAAMAGLGRDVVRRVPVDASRRMDTEALARAIDDDRRSGRVPVCVVANAGDVNTGVVDPLDRIADVCRDRRVWLHADAAYGGFAALAPSARGLFAGLERVDSMSLDPHKWLYMPVDVGCALVRDASALGRAFSYSADYVDVVASPDMSQYVFWDYSPELTRRFRALKIWMALKTYGVRAFAAAIERNIQLARRLAALIEASDDFELLAPVPLSIVCFRYTRGDDLNSLNRRLMLDVQLAGRAYPSNAMIDDAFALRACIVNHRTTEEDLGILLDEIRRCAQSSPSPPPDLPVSR